MSEMKYTILKSWPALKDDLAGLLSDTDAWVTSKLKEAHEAKDWGSIRNIIDIMELLHNMSHSH